jgi:hypothetical protein
MTKQRKPTHNARLHVELLSIVRQYSTGLITDIELLESCKTLQDLYAQLDVTELYDGNGIKYTSNPFATNKDTV